MDDWYPEAVRDPGNNAGSYLGDSSKRKGLVHTTEGRSYAAARAAYVTSNSWPHFTGSYAQGFFQIWQHSPISVASRSLRNLAGGVETNRDWVVQIELVGSCDPKNASWGDQYITYFPQGYLDGIAAWMRWVEAQFGVPRSCGVTFESYPASYGNNGVRLQGSAWNNYSGWLGHQHVPENDHGDPGNLNIAYLLGGTQTQTEEIEVPDSFLTRDVANAQVWCVTPSGRWPIANPRQRDYFIFTGLVRSNKDTKGQLVTSGVFELSSQDFTDVIVPIPVIGSPLTGGSYPTSFKLQGTVTPT